VVLLDCSWSFVLTHILIHSFTYLYREYVRLLNGLLSIEGLTERKWNNTLCFPNVLARH